MADQVKIPLDEQIASVEREIGMRKRVYGNWVASGKMKQGKADHEIAAMSAVLETLRWWQAVSIEHSVLCLNCEYTKSTGQIRRCEPCLRAIANTVALALGSPTQDAPAKVE